MSPNGIEVLKGLEMGSDIRVNYPPPTDLSYLLFRFERLDEKANALYLRHYEGDGDGHGGEVGNNAVSVASISLDNVPTAFVEAMGSGSNIVIELTPAGWLSIVRPLQDQKKKSILGRAGIPWRG